MRKVIMFLIVTMAVGLLLPATIILAQKPKVAIVVWDGNAKEGQNIGTFRLYQIGEPVSNLKVQTSRKTLKIQVFFGHFSNRCPPYFNYHEFSSWGLHPQ